MTDVDTYHRTMLVAAGALASAVPVAVQSRVYEVGGVGVYESVRVFGTIIGVFPVLVSLFAMLAIRPVFRDPADSWQKSVAVTFALVLLQLGAVVQLGAGVAYATLIGIGVGAAGNKMVDVAQKMVLKLSKRLEKDDDDRRERAQEEDLREIRDELERLRREREE